MQPLLNADTPAQPSERAPTFSIDAPSGDVKEVPLSNLVTFAPPGTGAIPRIVVFDAEETPTPDAKPRNRRGRPPGAQGALVADHGPVTADDMRFLSAFCQGVDPRVAARSYLSHNLHQDGRAALGYARQLLARLAVRASEHPDAAVAVAMVAQLQRRLAGALSTRPSKDSDEPANGSGVGQGGAGAPEPPVSPKDPVAAPKVTTLVKPARPTLEEFALRFDADMYTEAELIELYEEEFGQEEATPTQPPAPTPAVEATAPAPAPPTDAHPQLAVKRRLEIVEWLAPRLALPLTPESPLELWLEAPLATVAREQLGLHTVQELGTWINREGARFYLKVPGLGRARALRLLRWYVDRQAEIGVKLRPSLVALVCDEPAPGRAGQMTYAAPTKAAAASGLATQGFAVLKTPSFAEELGDAQLLGAPRMPQGGRHALVPLAQLHWPDELAGNNGFLRTREACLMQVRGKPVDDDRAALAYWLRNVVACKATETVRAYVGAIERFVLWALLERRRALSDLSLQDLVDFREFLYAPPAHWCSQARVMKGAEEWRPLRAALSPRSVRQTLDVVKLLYAFWHAQAYIRGNPVLGLKAESAREELRHKKPVTDATRSFAREDLLAMRRTLEEMPASPAQRRLRAILSLFVDSGVRRSEVETLTFGDLVPLRADGNGLSEFRRIEVRGKGDKPRQIPILPSTLQALQEHYEDRLLLVRQGRLPAHFAGIPRERTPVLSVLQAPETPRVGRRGVSPASATRVPSADGRLDAKTLYGILKTFFREVAQRPDLEEGQADFARASTHWLRHTFALNFLAANPSEIHTLRQQLGHTELSSTGRYLDARLEQRALAVARMERYF